MFVSETKVRVKDYDTERAVKILLPTQSTSKKPTKELWHFKKCTFNPEYQKGLRYIPAFDTCLIGSNDAKYSTINGSKYWTIKTQPKWNTELGYYEIDAETGEILKPGIHQTDEFKKSNAKKIKAMDAFADAYSNAYASGQISLLFHTFTRPNYAKMDFRRMLGNVVKRYKALGFNVTGYVWTAEVTDELTSKGNGLMWHYHLVVALDKRMNVKGKSLSDKLKFEDLWGQRTDVEFVKKNVRHYMAKYFAKHNARVIGTRSYGRTRKFRPPANIFKYNLN